jgi:hypothetical protein
VGPLSPRHGASSGCGWRRQPTDTEGSSSLGIARGGGATIPHRKKPACFEMYTGPRPISDFSRMTLFHGISLNVCDQRSLCATACYNNNFSSRCCATMCFNNDLYSRCRSSMCSNNGTFSHVITHSAHTFFCKKYGTLFIGITYRKESQKKAKENCLISFLTLILTVVMSSLPELKQRLKTSQIHG